MKKNKMMRAASGLLVATLLTTSVISGTFAKYVTSDSASDTARVAKWGVTVLASGSLFGENYNGKDDAVATNEYADGISATVMYNADSSQLDNIVAPGTKNIKGIKLAVQGKPEVENQIEVSTNDSVTEKNQEIWLTTGDYGVMVDATASVTTDNFNDYYIKNDSDEYVLASTYVTGKTYYELHDTVTVTENESGSGKYYPIEWTVTKSGTTGTLANNNYRTVSAMYTALSGEFAATNNANVKLDDIYTITWEWAFSQQNGADTILGNLMTNDNSSNYKVVKMGSGEYVDIENSDYNLNVGFNATITVTQID